MHTHHNTYTHKHTGVRDEPDRRRRAGFAGTASQQRRRRIGHEPASSQVSLQRRRRLVAGVSESRQRRRRLVAGVSATSPAHRARAGVIAGVSATSQAARRRRLGNVAGVSSHVSYSNIFDTYLCFLFSSASWLSLYSSGFYSSRLDSKPT
jgi:hypothetical protein